MPVFLHQNVLEQNVKSRNAEFEKQDISIFKPTRNISKNDKFLDNKHEFYHLSFSYLTFIILNANTFYLRMKARNKNFLNNIKWLVNICKKYSFTFTFIVNSFLNFQIFYLCPIEMYYVMKHLGLKTQNINRKEVVIYDKRNSLMFFERLHYLNDISNNELI